jgi:hypothetical protein
MAEAREGGVAASAGRRPNGWGGSGNPLSFGSARFPKPPDSASAFGHRGAARMPDGQGDSPPGSFDKVRIGALLRPGPNGRSSRFRPRGSTGAEGRSLLRSNAEREILELRLLDRLGKGEGLAPTRCRRPDFGSVVAGAEACFGPAAAEEDGASASPTSANGATDLVPARRRGRSPLRRSFDPGVKDEACLDPIRGNPRSFGSSGIPQERLKPASADPRETALASAWSVTRPENGRAWSRPQPVKPSEGRLRVPATAVPTGTVGAGGDTSPHYFEAASRPDAARSAPTPPGHCGHAPAPD